MRLLTKAISALPEREEATVLAFLLDRALVPPASGPAPVDCPEPGTGSRVEVRREAWRSDPTFWPRTGALLLLYQAAAGVSPAQLASELGVEPDVMHAILDDLSRRLRRSEPLSSVFRELAEGHTLGQAAEKLGIDVQLLAAELQPSDALVQSVSAAMMARTALPRAPTPYLGYSTRGPLRTMPVRLPEAQYQRLKDWSEAHSFPMSVVVRGLVERFLDDQQAPPGPAHSRSTVTDA